MALFQIIEPHEKIRRLYEEVVRGLGHEVAVIDGPHSCDPHVVLVEPADAESFEAALRLRRERPGLPILCASIDHPNRQARGLQPSTHLLKPFRLADLTDALQLALSQSDLLSGVTERVCAGRLE